METNNEVMVAEPMEMVNDSASMVFAQNKAEIDIQIATAKKYPRNVHKCLNDIVEWGTMDDETAQSCFYSLARKGKNGNSAVEGLSVRMAEIFADAWGNIRAASRVINKTDKTITAQAVCFDLERNVAIQTEVEQRITDKEGKTFSEDMQITAANAACSKAFRNAVFKVIPKAITAKAVNEIKQVSMGKAVNMTETRTKLINAFAPLGVKETDILEYLQITSRDEISKDDVFHLRGLYNAIKEGDTTIEESILATIKERKAAEAASKETTSNLKDAMAAAAKNFNKNSVSAPAEKVAEPAAPEAEGKLF